MSETLEIPETLGTVALRGIGTFVLIRLSDWERFVAALRNLEACECTQKKDG